MKITIPQPCHENWAAMTPEEKGRFCSVCSKTVRDFTVASDEEIINTFSRSSEDICGNFYESQLNRNLQYSYLNSVFVKFAVGFILTTGGFVAVNAQQNITRDTLKAEQLEVVLYGVKPKQKQEQMVAGAPTIVQESLLVKATENKTKETPLKSPGVVINQTPQNISGMSEIKIGGAKSSMPAEQPLVVMDGRMINIEEFGKVDPESIESVNVVKNGFADYGEKGKNGVIIIKSKRKRK